MIKQNTNPFIIVIFGFTGDLTFKKIIPSLWSLYTKGKLTKKFKVLGFSRRKLSNKDVSELINKSLASHIDINTKKELIKNFCSLFRYVSGTFEDPSGFVKLKSDINQTEKDWNHISNRLLYFAVAPFNYQFILTNIAGVNLNIQTDNYWTRLLIEKPFGSDLKSAKQLQNLLSKYFTENQVYRIDHYLFKEIVQGIANFRFSNNLFEHIWDNTKIERIDLRLYESIGIEGRGSFYDTVGALRDVGQNHLLSMLATLTMDYPIKLSVESFRMKRYEMLLSLCPWTQNLLKSNTYRAQYKGYLKEKGVNKNSKTETFFALKTSLKHKKWNGIPIYIEGGKYTSKVSKEIIITLKHPNVCYLCNIAAHKPNRIIFRFAPNDEIVINFWTKKPGLDTAIEERKMSFSLYNKKTKSEYVEEYAKVIIYATQGQQSLFVSKNEVEAMWAFTDPIIKAWHNDVVPLATYLPNHNPTITFDCSNKKN